jgi:tRNA-2-methylthio-N6-dimethylallyladenosine synthase
VLFERRGRHAGQLVGRSPYLQAVHARASERMLGRVVPVRVTRADANSLAGDVIATSNEISA